MKFTGELHNVRLINFSVNLEEVLPFVPKQLKILQEKGKAIISMVDVQLNNMKTKSIPFFKFGYRHVAFRLLLEDNSTDPKGVFFLKSFSNKPLLNFAGNLVSNYKLSNCTINEYFDAVSIKHEKKYINYALDPYSKAEYNKELYQKIKRIDRAYTIEKEETYVIRITRKKWPIEPIKCYHFATNYFKSAKFIGAFKVNEIIYYTWNQSEKV
jgi:hypothetical protein